MRQPEYAAGLHVGFALKQEGDDLHLFDANEHFSSNHRCCDDCLSREITSKDAEGREVQRTQYYTKRSTRSSADRS